MKKRILKSICSKALAVAVGTALLVQTQAPVVASAAKDPTLYISEVYLSYGKTDEEAKQWLKDNDYIIVDQNLNEGSEGGVSWLGLGSEKRSVYLGYKTTENSDDAITDMRAMNMNGDYSYEAYEKMLEAKGAEIRAFIGDLITALKEYRENYNAKKPNALIAHDNLNRFSDDDSNDALMGDLLLKPIKEEMTEEEYNKAPKEHADMTTVMMQGNVQIVREMMTYLAYAADTSDTTWLQRLGDANSVDALFKKYAKDFPSLSESRINTLLVSLYDESAKTFVGCLDEIKSASEYVKEVGLPLDADEQTAKKYFDEHKDKSEITWSTSAVILKAVENAVLGKEKLADIASSTEYDFSSADDRIVLYPLLEALSPGQRAMLPYTQFKDLIVSGSLDSDGWKKTQTEAGKINKENKPNSVYTGIIRSAFQKGGVALTNEARNMQSSTGSSFDDGLFGVQMSIVPIITGGAGILFAIAGGIMWSKGAAALNHNSAVQRSVDSIAVKVDDLKNKFIAADAAVMEKVEEARKGMGIGKMKFRISGETRHIAKNETLKSAGLSYYDLGDSFKEQVDDYYRELGKEDEIGDLILNMDEAKKELRDVKRQQELLDNAQENLESPIKFGRMKIVGEVLCIAGIIMAIGSAAYAIYDVYKYYHQEMKPIPRIIVSESSDELGRSKYTYYENVCCNREDKGFKNDKLGDYGDMNGDVGKQWLSLYVTKDKAAGDPITADIIAQKGSNKAPSGMNSGIRLFGQTDTVNIVSDEYGYKDSLNGLYIFFKTEKAKPSPDADPSSSSTDSSSETSSESESSSESNSKAAASVIGAGTLTLSCVGSAAIGALVCFIAFRSRKKDSESTK